MIIDVHGPVSAPTELWAYKVGPPVGPRRARARRCQRVG
jgi:hypothetical protein